MWASHIPGFPSRLATHALLQPTGNPTLSNGPLRAAGPDDQEASVGNMFCNELGSNIQLGPRSTGHSATGQPLLLVILIGRLYPSTRETAIRRYFICVETGRLEKVPS